VQNVSNTKGHVQAKILKSTDNRVIYNLNFLLPYNVSFKAFHPVDYLLWSKHFAEINTTDNIVVLRLCTLYFANNTTG